MFISATILPVSMFIVFSGKRFGGNWIFSVLVKKPT